MNDTGRGKLVKAKLDIEEAIRLYDLGEKYGASVRIDWAQIFLVEAQSFVKAEKWKKPFREK